MLEPEAVHEHAKAEKKKGDEEYLKAAFATAVMHYTRAIALTHGRHPAFIVSLFTNRAAAHIMPKAPAHLFFSAKPLSLLALPASNGAKWYYLSQEFAKAEEDSKVALKLDGRYLRAYVCRALSRFYLQQFTQVLCLHSFAQPSSPKWAFMCAQSLTSPCCVMQAFEDFERASKLEPGNTFLREKIQKAKETIAAIAQKKKDSTAKYVYHASDQATFSLTRSVIDPTFVVLLGNRNIKVNKGVLDWMGDTSLVGLDVEVTCYTHTHTQHKL